MSEVQRVPMTSQEVGLYDSFLRSALEGVCANPAYAGQPHEKLVEVAHAVAARAFYARFQMINAMDMQGVKRPGW